MNQFVKFVAKSKTWFKAGQEALWEDSNFKIRRPNLKEFEQIKKCGAAVFIGTRVCEDNPNENALGYKAGDERPDGEWCQLDEFYISIVDNDDYNVEIMEQGILYKTKTYLVGSMQNSDGRGWRNEITQQLNQLGIVCYDPYKKPFVLDVEESDNAALNIQELIANGDYDKVAGKLKLIRAYDLALVDKSDFIIAYIDPNVVTVGSYEELFWANRMKRPIFLIIEGGKAKTPWWLFGTIPHKYIYNNIDEVVQVLTKINSGEKEMDSDRWRLLRVDFR